MSEVIGVVGLGYVGLPVALAFARAFPNAIGFDIHREKVEALKKGVDRTGAATGDELTSTTLVITSDEAELAKATFFVVAVPTPVDANNRPDLTPVIKA